MSLITSFEYRGDRTARIRTQHKCGWFYAKTPEAGQILQLETYAKDGTTAQVFQLDRRMTGELLQIIAKVFLGSEGEATEQ